MSFESVLKNSLLSDTELGKARYEKNFKERQTVSKSRVDLYGSVKYLQIGESCTMRYADGTSVKYIAAPQITYDMIMTLYDINSRSMFAARFTVFDEQLKQKFSGFIDSIRKPKPRFEARIIGLQNNQDYKSLYMIMDFLASRKIEVYEVDLFGDQVRNVALDMRLGVSYNMLMEDRLYRAGELINKTTAEQFEKELKAQAPSKKA